MTNAVVAGVKRPIQFFHMPVVKARTDDAYFAPLKNLKLRPETELYLGLIHHNDAAGDAARLTAARRHHRVDGVGTECGMQIAQSAPDGYSLLFAQGAPLSLTPHAFKSVPYDVERDFEPIIFAGYGPLVLASSPTLPVANVAELIALAKRQPGKLSFATASARSIPHLAGEYFLSAAGIAMVNVPYNGYPRAIQDTMSGTVDVIFGGAQIIPQRDSGNLRMLGVTTARRIPGYEDIPAISETVPDYAIAGWAAVLAPKGTPASIVAGINADIRAVLETPDVRSRLHGLGNYPDTTALGTPEALARFIRDDSALMQRILKAANLHPEDQPK